MKIERLDLFHLAVPLRAPFRSSVRTVAECETLLVRIRGDGATGWGEVVCDVTPSYAAEIVPTARIVIETILAPALVGKSFESVQQAVSAFDWVRGNPMARAGVELALWDWWGRAHQVSVATLLGGTRQRVDVGVSIGRAENIGELEASIRHFQREGYRRFKLKITPEWLEGPLQAARAVLGDGMAVGADANGAFQKTDSGRLAALKGLDFLEQPLAWDDLVDHAELRQKGLPPICLDESVGSLASLRAALALGSLDVLNVKPGRVGGLLAARSCLAVAHAAGLQTFVGGMLETAIGRAGNVALASLSSVTLPSDLSASNRYFERDLATPFVLEDSSLRVPTGPGLGVTVDEEAVRAFSRS